MTPRAYQIEGYVFLANRARALLADPPGLGKTPQAILAARAVDARSICVICPAIAVVNWGREWAAWWPDGPAPRIISYDKVVRDKKLRALIRQGVDVLILDEAHYLKNRDSLRTKHVYNPMCPGKGLAARAAHCWALSGTFAPNDVTEYWCHLRALFPDLIPMGDRPMNYVEYLQHFTNWKPSLYGPKITGVKNKPELTRILRQVGLRREVKDVLPDLPPIAWGKVVVDSDTVRGEIRALEDTPAAWELRAHVEANEDFHAMSIHLSTLRRLLGFVKAPVIAEMVSRELFEGHYPKIVIWAHHVEVVAALAHALQHYGSLSINGSMTQAARTVAIDRFQSDPASRVIVCQLQAAGIAINLTAADQVLFAESSWVPAEMEQAAKRCHRYGQQRPVFVRVSALADSLDELVAATLTRKLSAHVEVGAIDHADAN